VSALPGGAPETDALLPTPAIPLLHYNLNNPRLADTETGCKAAAPDRHGHTTSMVYYTSRRLSTSAFNRNGEFATPLPRPCRSTSSPPRTNPTVTNMKSAGRTELLTIACQWDGAVYP